MDIRKHLVIVSWCSICVAVSIQFIKFYQDETGRWTWRGKTSFIPILWTSHLNFYSADPCRVVEGSTENPVKLDWQEAPQLHATGLTCSIQPKVWHRSAIFRHSLTPHIKDGFYTYSPVIISLVCTFCMWKCSISLDLLQEPPRWCHPFATCCEVFVHPHLDYIS